MIERYQLRYFLAVVDTGNFSRAAAQVNVTQPTLSVAIAKLETELQEVLFIRNSKRVHLTEAGARFLAHARAIEHEFNLLADRGPDAAAARPFRIGVLATIPTALLASLVAANGSGGKPVPLELVEGAERELLGKLQRRRIDAALTIIRPTETRYPTHILYREGYSLAAPVSHPAARGKSVEAEALAGDVMIVRRHCEVLQDTSRHFTARGVRPRFSYRASNDDRVFALVAAGLGVTVMPDSYRGPGVARVKLEGFDAQRDIGLMFADAATREAVPPRLGELLLRLRPTVSS